MAYQIDYAYTCHTGKVRANNEDNFWCCGVRLPVHNQELTESWQVIHSIGSFPFWLFLMAWEEKAVEKWRLLLRWKHWAVL